MFWWVDETDCMSVDEQRLVLTTRRQFQLAETETATAETRETTRVQW